MQEQARHGYAVAQCLEEAGLGEIKGGTLYPMLARLQAAGNLTTWWETSQPGPGRKYYALTDVGRALLREQSAEWATFTRTTQTLMNQETRDGQ